MAQEKKQNIVAFSLIGVGILCMLGNFPYVYGMIPQSNTLDIIFVTLLFGGALLALVGVIMLAADRTTQDLTPKDWLLKQNGKVFGPMPVEKIEKAWKAGKISAKDEVSNFKDGPWQPVTKLYAVAPLIDPQAKQKPTPIRLPPNTPVFEQIAWTFYIDNQGFDGAVIASPSFLYLVMQSRRNETNRMLGSVLGGGLIMGLVIAATERVKDCESLSIKSRKLTELHPKVLSHPAWPLKATRKDDQYQVVIVPRDMVAVLENPQGAKAIDFEVKKNKIRVYYRRLYGAQVRDYLVATGWPVHWDGKNVTRK